MHASRQLVGDKYTECEAASAMHQHSVTLGDILPWILIMYLLDVLYHLSINKQIFRRSLVQAFSNARLLFFFLLFGMTEK